MTTPATGAISISDINTEVGRTSTYSTDMSWIKANAKTTINGATGVINDFNNLHNKAWYANNTAGNCNNGNCVTGSANCGDTQCINCYNTVLTNCVNCDGATKYLQPNCNCACTYNCTSNQVTYNCACQCPIVCACACAVCACACFCFLGDANIKMADGSMKFIRDIVPGDFVFGSRGEINKVIASENHKLGSRSMYKINNEHSTTSDHPHLGSDGLFYGIKPEDVLYSFGKTLPALTEKGIVENLTIPSVNKERIKPLTVGVNLETLNGTKSINEIEEYELPEDTLIYSLSIDGSHTFNANGYIVGGWINESDYDYDLWTTR